MFMSSMGSSGKCIAFPDVCKVPTGIPPFIPTPFPNMAQTCMTLPSGNSMKVLASMMPTCTIASQAVISQGNTPGVLGGMVSNMVMGPMRYTMGSMKILLSSKPATRLTSPTGQNGASPNMVGIMLAPSQTKIMVLA
ncbi:MAG: hypothetical protein RL154_3 [Pseudomonadota bacterium]|jgi:hypothetical protein